MKHRRTVVICKLRIDLYKLGSKLTAVYALFQLS